MFVVLDVFLPGQLSTVELSVITKVTAAEVGHTSIQDEGKLVGKLMPPVSGKSDGTVGNEMANAYLNSL